MGTSNSGILRALADSRDAQDGNTVQLEALQEILTRVTDLQAAVADQQSDVDAIQAALIAMQATQAAHTSKLNALTTTVAVLPAMQAQIQAIHDAVVTTP